MLLARLLGWIKSHKTTHIFMLEIAAVFIGITGSLLVDNWRQQQADYETLDRELSSLFFNLSRSSSQFDVNMAADTDALEANVILAFEDLDRYSDEELVGLYREALQMQVSLPLEFRLNVNIAEMSIPYDSRLSLLLATLRDLDWVLAWARDIRDTGLQRQQELMRASGLADRNWDGASGIAHDDLVERMMAAYDLTGGLRGEFVGRAHNLAAIRDVLDSPEIRARFRDMIYYRETLLVMNVNLEQAYRAVISAIRGINPDIRIHFREIGIDGSGTSFGWQNYLPMRQDPADADTWRLEIELVDGEVKFRADNAWAVNWGATGSGGSDDTWGFSGDIDTVFPRGIATVNGSNIPVRAGRYNVEFNTATLEYVFEEIAAID